MAAHAVLVLSWKGCSWKEEEEEEEEENVASSPDDFMASSSCGLERG